MSFYTDLLALESSCQCLAGCAIADLDTGTPLAVFNENVQLKSASLIKTPIMLAILREVEAGHLSMTDRISISEANFTGDSKTLTENDHDAPLSLLLEIMITDSDNTATNALIDLIGMDSVNALCRELDLPNTQLRRHMLDFEAAARGEENTTSAADMLRLYTLIYKQQLLSPAVCEMAMPILLRQHGKNLMLSAMPQQKAAHKLGGLPGISHDTGILFGENHTIGFAVLTWSDDEEKGERFHRQASLLMKEQL